MKYLHKLLIVCRTATSGAISAVFNDRPHMQGKDQIGSWICSSNLGTGSNEASTRFDEQIQEKMIISTFLSTFNQILFNIYEVISKSVKY